MTASVTERPGKVQWAITRGDDVAMTCTFVDGSAAPIDLSGSSFTAKVQTGYGTDVVSVTVGTGSAATGVLTLSMDDTTTAALTSSGYVWWLQETAGGVTTTLLDGPLVVAAPGQAGVGSGSSSVTVTVSTSPTVTVTCTAAAVSGGGGGSSSLSGLSDVSLASPANNDTLGYNGTDWVNRSASAQRTAMGLGTAALSATGDFDAAGAAAAAQAASQPLDSDLTAIAALTTTTFGRALLALADAAALRTAAGLGSLATLSTITTSEITDGTITNADINAAAAIAQSKISGLVAALALLAPLNSPTFTGSPTVPGYLPLVAAGASVENVGAIESNVNTVAATGATETLDTSLYAVHDCTMDQACAFTFSNPAPSGKNSTFMLVLRGAFTPTLPASVKWSGGSAPSYSTPSVYVFSTVDAGTTWLGSQVGKAFA